ncbi:unnamed protein product [Scytosiphon promiscuus]
MTEGAPATGCDIGVQNMKAKVRTPDIETIRPKGGSGHVNTAAYLNTGYQEADAAVKAMPQGSQQEQLEQIADLMKLKDTHPDEFAAYVQMAADAAKLAEERPDVYKKLMEESEATVEDDLTAARAEQKRAMDAASELIGATSSKGGGKEGMGISLPGGGTLGEGGAKEQMAGVVISPKPGFVIKTKLLETGMKVFVNVCQHERIGESGMMKKLDKEGQEVEGLNIPMSVGPPLVDKDNKGEECIVYDVIINPKAIEECRADKTGGKRDWVCHVAMQSVMSKHDCRLDPKYKLPKLTFKGNKQDGPAKQRIRDDSAKPQISEVKAATAGAKSKGVPSAEAGSSRSAVVGAPDRRPPELPKTKLKSTTVAVWATGGEGGSVKEDDVTAVSLEETVRIPLGKWPDSLVVTAAGLRKDVVAVERLSKIGVQASAYDCTVHAPGHYPLQASRTLPSTLVRLPYAVIPDTASAHTNCHDGTLTVTLQVCKSPLSKQADIGSKAWLLSKALDAGVERQAGQVKAGGAASGVASEVREAAAAAVGVEKGADDLLPEDRFHLRLPKGVNQYTGVAEEEGGDHDSTYDRLGKDQDCFQDQAKDKNQQLPVGEGDDLPEERFHRADIVSQHMIDTRERQRKEKIDRAEEEREARKKGPRDDGVEYVDFDVADYRAGGKLGPPAAPTKAPARPSAATSAAAETQDPNFTRDMAAATRVLSDAVKEKEGVGGGVGGSSDGAAVASRLSSTFWADLLD